MSHCKKRSYPFAKKVTIEEPTKTPDKPPTLNDIPTDMIPIIAIIAGIAILSISI